jgi:hypothetical protein
VAVFAAFGTERLLAGRLGSRYAYGWLIGGAAVTLFALAGGFNVIAQNVLAIPQYADKIDANSADVKVGALRSLLFVCITAVLIILASREKISRTVAGWALVALCAVDLWSIERLYWEFSPPAAQLYATDTTIEFLQKLSQPVRVLAIGSDAFPMAPNDANLMGDGLMAHDVRITCGYHGNAIGRYVPYCGRDEIGNPTMWALTNTEFILANMDTIGGAGIRRVVGPIKDAAGTRVSLFELPGEHPFAWVAPVMIKYPDSAVEEAFKSPNFPVHSVAIFDTASKVAAAQVTSLPAPLTMTARVDKYAPGHIELTLSDTAPKNSALVVSENFYPGWHATVDGKPAIAERADLTLIGIALPEGAKKVSLDFTSSSYEEGKTITLIAIAISILAILGGIFAPGAPAGPPAATGMSERRPAQAA